MAMLLCLVGIWSIQTLLSATATISLRCVSRARLAAALRQRGKAIDLDRFDRRYQQYALTTLIYWQAGIVACILTIHQLLPPGHRPYDRPLQVFALAAAWFVVFSVSVPTAWARYSGEKFLARGLPLIEALHGITRPLLWLIRGIDELVRRLAGVSREEVEQTAQMERMILDAVSEADLEGPVDESEKAMIRSVMSMDETSVGQVMTPRTDLIGVELSSDFEKVRETTIQAAHSRIPVYEETLDHIVGILHARDLLGVTDPADFSLRKIMRPAYFVPETKDTASLLREFQAGRRGWCRSKTSWRRSWGRFPTSTTSRSCPVCGGSTPARRNSTPACVSRKSTSSSAPPCRKTSRTTPSPATS